MVKIILSLKVLVLCVVQLVVATPDHVVNIGSDEGKAQHIVCIPPKTVKKFKDRLKLEKISIVLGAYDKQEEAQKVVDKIVEVNKENKYNHHNINPAIWAKRLDSKKMEFVVIASNTNDIITKGEFSKIKEKYGMDFDVRDSWKLQYKVKQKKTE